MLVWGMQKDAPITLHQFSRALAAHALIVAHPDVLHGFFAPENGEAVAALIERFALGETLDRAALSDPTESATKAA